MARYNTYVGVNHRSVKQSNRAMIFRAIRALGPVARVDLAQQTGLNAATVSNIVDELLEAGLATESGTRSSSKAGRRAVQLEIAPTSRHAIGIDLAKSAITVALVDLAGGTHHRTVYPATGPWRDDWSKETACRLVEDLVAALSPEQRAGLVGIGIGAPSPLSIRSGRYLASPYFDKWHDLDLKGELERQLGLPTYVDNNGNASALAELWFGAGQGVDNFALLTLGAGVGTGLVLGGDLYRGDHDLAGEAGHISINVDGPACTCGNFGCLETYVSVPRVLAAVREAGAAAELTDAEDDLRSIESVVAALRAGDDIVGRVFADVARHLAVGIVNVVYAVDPELVLLGRELAAAGDALLEPVRAEVRRRVFPAMRDAVRIEAAALPDMPVIGAATLALREFFRAPLEPTPAIATTR